MTKYRSKFEEDVANILGEDWEYEKHKYSYKIPRKYTPDFVLGNTLVEVKGFFRVGDVAKYRSIAVDNPDKRLVFIFSDPNKKVRKGAKMSMSEWAEKNGWLWCTLKDMRLLTDGLV